MRRLGRLERTTDHGLPSEPVWGPRQSVMFVGGILAALSVAGSLLAWGTFPQAPRRDWGPEMQRLRQQFRGMPPREALWVWNDLARRGIGPAVTADQQALAERRRKHWRWCYLAASVGAAGLLLLGAGLAMPGRVAPPGIRGPRRAPAPGYDSDVPPDSTRS